MRSLIFLHFSGRKGVSMSSYLVLLLSVLVIGCAQNTSWKWNWSCDSKNGKCIRVKAPVNTTNNTTRQTNALCKITCGRYGSLWPKPTGTTVISSDIVPFNIARLHVDLATPSTQTRDLLANIARLFVDGLRNECSRNTTTQGGDVSITIAVTQPDVILTWETDEAYSLKLVTEGNLVQVQISAQTIFGARHAVETLRQLTACSPNNGQPTLYIVKNAQITDRPIYPHRGLLLDTARNYIPVKDIRRQIDAMAASKLNVLHLHMTDSHSFPLQSKRVPQLSRFGAYSEKQIYSLVEISRLIQYGLLRGVRIIPEIDAPSHAGEGWQWGPAAGLGNLAVCVGQQPWRKFCIQPPCGQLNPSNAKLYHILRELYKDIVEYFPQNEVLHMGGDEVFFPCWNSTAEIVNWMISKGHGRSQDDFLQVWSEFQNKALNILDEIRGHSNTPTILWSSHLTQPDVIDRFLNKNRYIIETWVEAQDDLPKQLLSKGYRLIMATKDTWYLDHGFWGSTKYHTWPSVYNNRLPRVQNVLGGEVAMWSELVDKAALDSRVWPRAAALAERLWSDPELTATEVEARFYHHRERLIARGIRAAAVVPKWCFLNEGECQ